MGEIKHNAQRFLGTLPFFILFFLIVGFVLWKAFLEPKLTQNIKVEKGASAQFTTINKASRWFIMFTELGVDNRDNNLGVYTRAGIRLEF